MTDVTVEEITSVMETVAQGDRDNAEMAFTLSKKSSEEGWCNRALAYLNDGFKEMGRADARCDVTEHLVGRKEAEACYEKIETEMPEEAVEGFKEACIMPKKREEFEGLKEWEL